jgi:hypothetical protein
MNGEINMIIGAITAMDWVAIIGAAAWTPQIITWLYRFFSKPKISLHLHPQSEIGYTIFGPIFNVTLAILSEKKDATLNKISVLIKHENGASYAFDWTGLSEDLSEIQNPLGPTLSIKKTFLPLVVRVLHTGVAQVFVRFQCESFKAKYKEVFNLALEKFQLLKRSGKLKTEQDIDALITEKEFDDIIKLLNAEFIWRSGNYTIVFEFKSPSKFAYKKEEYTFNLSQDDIDDLKSNINKIKLDIIQNAKKEIFPDFESEAITWTWKNPALQKKTV